MVAIAVLSTPVAIWFGCACTAAALLDLEEPVFRARSNERLPEDCFPEHNQSSVPRGLLVDNNIDSVSSTNSWIARTFLRM